MQGGEPDEEMGRVCPAEGAAEAQAEAQEPKSLGPLGNTV